MELRSELEEAQGDKDWFEHLLDRQTAYAKHIVQCHVRLRRLISGNRAASAPDITRFLEQGILQPAREALRSDSEEIYISVLMPDRGAGERGAELTMSFSAGFSIEAHEQFRLPVHGAFCEPALTAGEVVSSGNLEEDSRYVQNPRTEPHPAHGSLMSVPIYAGDDVAAVFNVMSSTKEAFGDPEEAYILAIAGILDLMWTYFASQTSG